jgi:hypothetical protein
MTDNDLFALVRATILAGLEARGFTGWDVARSYAPNHQGANTQPTVYLFKVGPDRRIGSPQQVDAWDETAQAMRHTVSQQFESTFQASVLMDESTNEWALTPSDVLHMVADILQTDEGMQALRAQAVGILRIAEVRNPYNVNDRDQFAAAPSFDYVLTYRRTRSATVGHAVSIDGGINRV